MVINLSEQNSIAGQFIAELRDVEIQRDRLRFRTNVQRLGKIFAYEISKTFAYRTEERETPLGVASVSVPSERVIIASILRAGLPLHEGMLDFIDYAENAFISAYRKHHKDGTFEINLEYATCPNLDGSILILTDAMLATGSSFHAALKILQDYGTPKSIHIATIIGSSDGINYISRLYPKVKIWVGAQDEELTAKSFIVPGLGDAGDLLYGEKLQE